MVGQRRASFQFKPILPSAFLKRARALALPIGVTIGGAIGFAVALKIEAGLADGVLWTLAGELAGGIISVALPAIFGWLVELILAAGIVVAFFAAIMLAGRL